MTHNNSQQEASSDDQSSAAVQVPALSHDPYKLAAALLYFDRVFILRFAPLLFLPDILALTLQLPPAGVILLEFSKRFFQLYFLFLILRNWRALLSPQGTERESPSFLPLLFIGTTLWLLLALPATLLTQAEAELGSFLALLMIPACFIWLRYFFYFVPFGLGARRSIKFIQEARQLTERDWLSPLKVLISPLACTALLVALVSAIAPDGSILETDYLAAISLSVFPILASYLALSFAILLAGDKLWHDYGLDPYRSARLDTILVQQRDWLSNVLRPRYALLLLFLASMIGSANTFRAATTHPEVRLEIMELTAHDNILHVRSKAIETGRGFRGFRPSYLRLAGEQGGPISEPKHPLNVWVDGEALPFLAEIQAEKSEVLLEFEFQTDRSASDLVQLKDLFLWYRNVALLPVDLSKVKIEER